MFALSARWVLPISSPPLEDGYVTIDGTRIVAVGRDRPTCPVTELGNVALLPGLINCHTHLEFSGLQQPLGQPGMPLPTWIRAVISQRRDNTDREAAVRAGLTESLRCGVTTLGEIATEPFALKPFIEAKPVRATVFREFIAFDAAQVETVGDELTRHARQVWPPNLRPGISPHAPYTVHPDVFSALVSRAAAERLPLAFHLAESREELEFLRDGTGLFRALLDERGLRLSGAIAAGTRPYDYLQQLSAAPRSLVIHGNYLEVDEIQFLASQRKRMSVVYCPRTHTYFGHEPYPLAEMLAAGVNVALGTDSRASNPDLSLLEEMRHVAQRGDIALAEVLKLGTINAAHALGIDDVGQLIPASRADVIAVELPEQVRDPYEVILASSGKVVAVYLAGQPLGGE